MYKTSDNILVYNHHPNHKDYPVKIYRFLYDMEPNNFWFRVRSRIINVFIRKIVKGSIKEKTFLEIGCGTGFVLSSLEKIGFKVTGIDMSLRGLKLARKRSKKATLICSDITKKAYNKKFDCLGLFDVLEHIENDFIFLKKCCSYVKKNGLIFITVPADMRLWSYIDQISGHKKRYQKSDFSQMFKRLGFTVLEVSYYNIFLYLPQFMLRKFFDKKSNKNKNKLAVLKKSFYIHPFLNKIFYVIFSLESTLLRFISFPFGASLIVVAKRKMCKSE